MTKHVQLLALSALAALASGCATSSYCIGDLPYQQPTSIPSLESEGGPAIPVSQGALLIPPPRAEASPPYGEVVVDDEGKKRASCLDKPPRLAELPPQEELEPEPAVEPEAEESADS